MLEEQLSNTLEWMLWLNRSEFWFLWQAQGASMLASAGQIVYVFRLGQYPRLPRRIFIHTAPLQRALATERQRDSWESRTYMIAYETTSLAQRARFEKAGICVG